MDAAPPPRRPAFVDARRLIGPNRHFDGPAVALTPLGAAAHDAAAHAAWAAQVRQLCAALGWPDPRPQVLAQAGAPALAFAAPPGLLFSAGEINEWAWEHAAAAAGDSGFEAAQDLGDDPPQTVFARRCQDELNPPLEALRAAAAARGLPFLEDDDELSLGAGAGSRRWPLDALPAVDDVPWDQLHDLPTVLVSGSHGKTTTVRLLAQMLHGAGLAVGRCDSEGVCVGGRAIERGDYAGPAGARALLRHRGVHAAVLETAGAGLLRRGLAVARADVALVMRLGAGQWRGHGLEGTDALAPLMLVPAHAVQRGGHLVLAGDDAALLAAAAHLPHAAAPRRALFARDHDAPALQALRAAGGSTCGARAGRLILSHGGAEHDLGALAAMPITLGGAAPFHAENAAAAALAAACLDLAPASLAATLQQFGARAQDNPGRLERWPWRGATVLLDCAHDAAGLTRLLQVARALAPGARLGLLLGLSGHRDDAALAALCRAALAFAPARVLVHEAPLQLQGRAPGELPVAIERELRAAGLPAACLQRVDDEEAAAHELLAWCGPGDVVLLPLHTRALRQRMSETLADGEFP